MTALRKITGAVAAAAAVALISSPAYAQVSLGSRVRGVLDDAWGPIFVVAALIFACVGIYAIYKGLMILKDSASNGQATFGQGGAWIAAGMMLLMLPDSAGMGLMTLFGQNERGSQLASISRQIDINTENSNSDTVTGRFLSGITPAAPANCLQSQAPGACMSGNLARNVVPIGIVALFGVACLAGIIMFGSAIMTAARSTGPNSRGGEGWPIRLVISVLLINAPLIFMIASRTLFGSDESSLTLSGLNSGSPLLSYRADGSDERLARFQEMIAHSFVILAFFGAWAFIRGLFMLSSVAQGRSQQGSYAMASVYIFAGVLLAQAKGTTCVILYTVAGSGGTMGFCS